MRYFTRGWANGELSEEESERVVQAYREHVKGLSPRLKPDMLRLVNEVNLHDGLIESVTWSPAQKRLGLSLVVDSHDVVHLAPLSLR